MVDIFILGPDSAKCLRFEGLIIYRDIFTVCPLKRLYGAVCGAVSDKILIGDKAEGISFRLFIEGSVLLIGWSDLQKAGIALAGEKILGRTDGQVGKGRGQVLAAEIIRAEDHILVSAVCFPGRINDDGIRGVGQCAAKRAGIIVQIIGSIGDMIKVGIMGAIEIVSHLAGTITNGFIFGAAGFDGFQLQQGLDGDNKWATDNMCAHIEQGAGIIKNKQREFPL